MIGLTKSQQELVENNHCLISKFAYKHRDCVDLSEHYDILAIALCEAAQTYEKDKGKFAPFVYMKMKSAMAMENRKQNTKKRGKGYQTLPLDNPAYKNISDSEKSFTLAEIQDNFFSQAIMNRISFEDDIVNKIAFENYIDSLEEEQRIIVKELLKNKKQEDIAHKIGCSRQKIGYQKTLLRKKWDNFNKF